MTPMSRIVCASIPRLIIQPGIPSPIIPVSIPSPMSPQAERSAATGGALASRANARRRKPRRLTGGSSSGVANLGSTTAGLLERDADIVHEVCRRQIDPGVQRRHPDPAGVDAHRRRMERVLTGLERGEDLEALPDRAQLRLRLAAAEVVELAERAVAPQEGAHAFGGVLLRKS